MQRHHYEGLVSDDFNVALILPTALSVQLKVFTIPAWWSTITGLWTWHSQYTSFPQLKPAFQGDFLAQGLASASALACCSYQNLRRVHLLWVFDEYRFFFVGLAVTGSIPGICRLHFPFQRLSFEPSHLQTASPAWPYCICCNPELDLTWRLKSLLSLSDSLSSFIIANVNMTVAHIRVQCRRPTSRNLMLSAPTFSSFSWHSDIRFIDNATTRCSAHAFLSVPIFDSFSLAVLPYYCNS